MGMTVVCAWCEKTEQRGPTQPAASRESQRVSHGICRSCLEAQLASPPPLSLSAQPAPLAVPA